MMPPSRSVLMVCTGNIGRSPMMERIMRHQLRTWGADDRVLVSSAGTWAVVGQSMEPFAERVLGERGADARGFHASPLTAESLAVADLVITATREHRTAAVGLLPGAVRRTFTLLELARIVSGSREAFAAESRPRDFCCRWDAAVNWASRMRGVVPRPSAPDADDLPDPLGEPIEVYRARADAVARALEQVVPFLLGGEGDRPPG